MKRLSIFIIACVAILLTSCNGISPETSKAFVGEYWMETVTYSMNGNQVIEDVPRTKWSPVSIYEEDGELLIQTNWYGAPYLSDEFRENYAVIEYPERPEYISLRKIPSEDGDENSEDENGGIEDIIITDNQPVVFLMNGFIYVIRNGVQIKSYPNTVKSGSSTILELNEFTPVDVMITDISGNSLGTVSVNYEYSKIVKKGDAITWRVDLTISGMSKTDYGAEFDRVVHENTLYKR